jgi:hypothetical protein
VARTHAAILAFKFSRLAQKSRIRDVFFPFHWQSRTIVK